MNNVTRTIEQRLPAFLRFTSKDQFYNYIQVADHRLGTTAIEHLLRGNVYECTITADCIDKSACLISVNGYISCYQVICVNVYGEGVRLIACWDCGFESCRGHGCLFVVSVMCCQLELSATGRSLVQRSPTDCVVSLYVI